MAVPDKAFHDNLLKNSTRLLADAVLLFDHERFASAFALAVLALEELGKLILSVWFEDRSKPRDRVTTHVDKQRAVAALLLAQRTVSNAIALELDLASPSEQDIEQLAKAMFESQEGQFSRHVDMTVLDRTKQLAIYLDRGMDDPELRATNFKAVDVCDMFEKIKSTAVIINDDRLLRVGLAIYLHRLSPTWKEPIRLAHPRP